MINNLDGRMQLRKICGFPVDDLKYLQNLSSINEELLSQEHDRHVKILEKEISPKNKETIRTFSMGYDQGEVQDKISMYKDSLPKIMRYALFVAIMSITENAIASLCKASIKILGIKDKFDDRNQVITLGIEFLQKNTKIDLTKKQSGKIWAKLEELPTGFAFPDNIKEKYIITNQNSSWFLQES